MRACAIVLVLGAWSVGFLGCGKATKQENTPAAASDTTGDFCAALVIHPRRILGPPRLVIPGPMGSSGYEAVFAQLAGAFGVDLRDCEEIVLFFAVPAEDSATKRELRDRLGAAFGAATLRFARGADARKRLTGLWRDFELKEESVEGTLCLRPIPPDGAKPDWPIPVFLMPDAHTVMVVPTEDRLRWMLSDAGAKSPLRERVQSMQSDDVAAIVLVAPARKLVEASLGQRDVALSPVSRQLAGALPHLKEVTLKVNLLSDLPVRLTLEANDPDAATQLETLARKLCEMLREAWDAAGPQIEERERIGPAWPDRVAILRNASLSQLIGGIQISKAGSKIEVLTRLKTPGITARVPGITARMPEIVRRLIEDGPEPATAFLPVQRPEGPETAKPTPPPHRVLTREDVLKAWQFCYQQQARNNPWPEQLGQEFLTAIDRLSPEDEIPAMYREAYGVFARQRVRQLGDLVDVRMTRLERESPRSRLKRAPQPPGEPKGPPTPVGVPLSEIDDRVAGIVDWPEADRARLEFEFDWRVPPRSAQVRTAQESLWIYESLLRAIRDVNKGATSQRNAVVKKIEILEVGHPAVLAAMRLPGPGDASAPSVRTGPVPMSGPASMPKDMLPGAAAPPMVTPVRYVYWDGTPISEGEESPFAEFRLVPFRMRLVVDQRGIASLMAACANASMPLDIHRVSLRPEDGAPVNSWRSAEPMGMPSPSGAPRRGTAMKDFQWCASGPSLGFPGGGLESCPGATDDEDPLAISVEIAGLVHIYSPPDPAKLGTGLIGPRLDLIGHFLARSREGAFRWLELLKAVNACLPRDPEDKRPAEIVHAMSCTSSAWIVSGSRAWRTGQRWFPGEAGTCLTERRGPHWPSARARGDRAGSSRSADITTTTALSPVRRPAPSSCAIRL